MVKIKQVIVMRNDLGMRKGKMIAQGSHASMAFLSDKIKNSTALSIEETLWLEGKFTKICVRVNSEEQLLEIYQKALNAGVTVRLITDSGLTEFGGVATHTCLAIGPHVAEKIDPITKDLELL